MGLETPMAILHNFDYATCLIYFYILSNLQLTQNVYTKKLSSSIGASVTETIYRRCKVHDSLRFPPDVKLLSPFF